MYIVHVYALELLTWLNYFHFRHYRLLVVLSTPFVQSWHFPRNHMVHVLFKASHAYAVTWQGRFTCLLGNLLWHPPLWNAGNITKEAGPVNMNFTIPMYNASKLQVRPSAVCFFVKCIHSHCRAWKRAGSTSKITGSRLTIFWVHFKVSHVLFETCLYMVLYTLSSYVVYIFFKAFTAQKHWHA